MSRPNEKNVLKNLPRQLQDDLAKEPEWKQNAIIRILAEDHDGRGRHGEIFTPTGSGKHP